MEHIIYIIGAIIAISLATGIMAFMGWMNEPIDDECCDKICNMSGTKCLNNFGSKVRCVANYSKWGHPDIEEEFTFYVNNITRYCGDGK
jgi:hypothetical protein